MQLEQKEAMKVTEKSIHRKLGVFVATRLSLSHNNVGGQCSEAS